MADLHCGRAADDIWPANYVVCRLVGDSRKLGGARLQKIVAEVLPVLKNALKSKDWNEEEYPYCSLGEILLAQDLGQYERADRLAAELIEEDDAVRELQVPSDWEGRFKFRWGSEFVLGLSCFDSLHPEWMKLIETLKNPNRNEEMQLVIDAFAAVRRWRE